jgi:hypothetical protein
MAQLIGFLGYAVFFSEGFAAQGAGVPRDANPYSTCGNEEEAKAWFTGWDNAVAVGTVDEPAKC